MTSSTRSPAEQRLDAAPGCAPTRCPRSRRRPGPVTLDARGRRSAGAAGGCPRRRRRRRPRALGQPGRRVRRPGRSGSPRAPARRGGRSDRSRRRSCQHAPRRRVPGAVQCRVTAAPAAPAAPTGLSRTADGRRRSRARRGAAARRRCATSDPVRRLGGDRRRSRCSRCSCGCGTSARPHAFLFDETYYAKDAWSLWHFGYVTGLRRRRQRQDPGRPHRPGCGPDAPSMVVHPEVGKWLIGAGREGCSGWTRSAGGSPRRSSAR